jgi:hypothetical protein
MLGAFYACRGCTSMKSAPRRPCFGYAAGCEAGLRPPSALLKRVRAMPGVRAVPQSNRAKPEPGA